MAFAGGEDAVATNKMHETLKLLYETIQKQTIATDKQSRVMIWLTLAILVFTFCLFGIAVYQVKVIDTKTYGNKTPHHDCCSQVIKIPNPITPKSPIMTNGDNGKNHK